MIVIIVSGHDVFILMQVCRNCVGCEKKKKKNTSRMWFVCVCVRVRVCVRVCVCVFACSSNRK